MIVVKWVKAVWDFWYDFVVGDDWRLAVGAIFALGVTALLAHATSIAAWWFAPVVVVALVVVSTYRMGKKAASGG